MSEEPTIISVSAPDSVSGVLAVEQDQITSPIWTRVKLTVRTRNIECRVTESEIFLSWPDLLGIIREFGSKAAQQSLNFRFRPHENAVHKLNRFADDVRTANAGRSGKQQTLSQDEIRSRLETAGFTMRELKPFQLRDLQRLLSLANGANFSVPGAGKTTVTFALHILTKQPGQHLLVVAPKAANQAWKDIVLDCMEAGAPDGGAEPFTILDGTEKETLKALTSGATRFVISYDLMVRQDAILAAHLATTPTHLVLDESHRMKAGWQSQRGAFLLNAASLPVRRDILSGTPMPQSASDIVSQLDFLWPGHGYGLEISQGKSPREVLGQLYSRTTKTELGLPPARRIPIDVEMKPGQLALYSIVRNEILRDFSRNLSPSMGEAQLLKARKSVMRLLQLSINPTLALTAMANDDFAIDSAIADSVLEEGNSAKMSAVIEHARKLAREGKKTVIWTIFTDTIYDFVSSLADLNPVFIHGGVRAGSDMDPDTREGRIRRFHEDDNCFVLIANPAAAGEGISLHTVCHNAIYADRSYVSTHYLQSIDRIHRLGLKPNQETNIYIYRSKAPVQIGSVDASVSRRLIEKINNMQELLDDPDLRQIGLDEESVEEPIDYDIELEDIMDLISELEGRYSESGTDEA